VNTQNLSQETIVVVVVVKHKCQEDEEKEVLGRRMMFIERFNKAMLHCSKLGAAANLLLPLQQNPTDWLLWLALDSSSFFFFLLVKLLFDSKQSLDFFPSAK
jgi:hypothetical protein